MGSFLTGQRSRTTSSHSSSVSTGGSMAGTVGHRLLGGNGISLPSRPSLLVRPLKPLRR